MRRLLQIASVEPNHSLRVSGVKGQEDSNINSDTRT